MSTFHKKANGTSLSYGNVSSARWRYYSDRHQKCYLKTANINVKKLTSLTTMLRTIKS
jgi:hypothetical protein